MVVAHLVGVRLEVREGVQAEDTQGRRWGVWGPVTRGQQWCLGCHGIHSVPPFVGWGGGSLNQCSGPEGFLKRNILG